MTNFKPDKCNMAHIKFVESLGGRDQTVYKDREDCVIRAAVELITRGQHNGTTYEKVRKQANAVTKAVRKRARKPVKSFRDNRVVPKLYAELGLVKITLPPGSRLTFAEAHEEYGDCIVSTAGHVCALVDGALRDEEDCRTYEWQDDLGLPTTRERKAMSVWIPALGDDPDRETNADTIRVIAKENALRKPGANSVKRVLCSIVLDDRMPDRTRLAAIIDLCETMNSEDRLCAEMKWSAMVCLDRGRTAREVLDLAIN